MSYDPTKDPTQPVSWSTDPVQRGIDERKTGNGSQLGWGAIPNESYGDWQRRTTGNR